MNVFKTAQGIYESIQISEKTFTEATGKKQPYYVVDEQTKRARCFAVCPLCDNPIQIIGLYKAHNEGKNPYGKHFPNDIARLANYDEEAYYGCSYANPNREKKVIKRKPDNPTSKAMYELLKKQFDRLVYILEQNIEIKISIAFAEEILRIYCENEGWRYYESTYDNLPFMLIYALQAKPLVNRLILKNGELCEALKSKCNNIYFEETANDKYVKVKAESGFVNLSFYLCNHNIVKKENDIDETYRLVVTETDKIIYEKNITVDPSFLPKLMNLSSERSHRNFSMLEIAERIMR